MKFYSHVLTYTRLQADPSKIDAIVKMRPPPPDVKTLQSYLGLVNYMARFQPSLSSVLRPLRDLLKEKVDYVWSPEADKASNDIKGTDQTGTFMSLKCVVYYANYRSGHQSSKIQVVP